MAYTEVSSHEHPAIDVNLLSCDVRGLQTGQKSHCMRHILGFAQMAQGNLGQPDDIAHAVAYLAGPGAGYVTGQELHVNGGMFMA